MSLTKLFNFHYMFENIKKSKMPIVMCMLVVPLFTTILLLTSNVSIYTFGSLGFFNILFMYVIPFILSVNLFGYIYKKNSVDFIGSMPLSRKTIFFTNTLAGILLVLAMQLVTLLCTLVISTFSDSIIFAELAWDVFLYQTVSYIFMFTIANLAMSVSGNMMTQIVGVLLITFLVPALYTFTYYASEEHISNMISEHTNVSQISHFDTLTAPSIILSVLESGGGYQYNTTSMVKMLILSVIYVGIGYVFFKKRKMEKAGESFVKKSTHIIIKALTLIPFVMMVKLIFITEEWEALPFILGVIFVYWFVYDLITSKRMKFIQNLGILIASVSIIFAVLSGMIWIHTTIWNSKIKIENIAKLELSENWYPHKRKVVNQYSIKDKELIASIVDNNYHYTEADYRNEKKTPTHMFGTMTMKNGRKYEINVSVDAKDLEKVYALKETNQKLPLNKNIKVSIDSRIASREDKKEMAALLKKMTPYQVKSYNGFYYDDSAIFNISAYEYVNHEIYTYRYEESKELRSFLIKLNNKAACEQLRNAKPYEIYYDVYDSKNSYSTYSDTEKKAKLKEFIIANKEEQVDLDKECIYITLNITSVSPNLRVIYSTNKVSEVIENFTLSEEELKNYYDRFDNKYEIGEMNAAYTDLEGIK